MPWRRFFERAKRDLDQSEELASYIQIATDENIARGMPPPQARAAAHRKLGNGALVREEIYRMNTIGFLDALGRNLHHAWRMLRGNPTFTVIALLTLALGIGANTAIFSVVNGVLIRPLPYPNAGELVALWHSAAGLNIPTDLNCSPTMYFTYREESRTFQDVGIWNNGGTSVTGMGDPEQVRTVFTTYGTLQALGVQPLLGRWFSQEDDSVGGTEPNPVILTYGYWQRRFGGDKSVIGRRMTVDSSLREIVGVMPQNFRFLNVDPELISTIRFDRNRVILGNFSFQGIARLKPGVSLAQANADVGRMLPIWLNAWPMPFGASRRVFENWKLGPSLHPLKQDVVGNAGSVLWVLMGTIGMVLLIACANVANLLLVRAEGRQQELAIRAALGAGRGRIARELLLESVLLGVLGGALGVGLAYAGLQLLVAIGPGNLPRLNEISIDPQALWFALAVSLVSGLLFGLIPALKYAGPRIATGLRAGGRNASDSRERHRARNTLVVMQVALALVLLVSSGLMIRTFQTLLHVQPGFTRPEELQTVRISIPQMQDGERVGRMQSEIRDKIAAIPGVTSVGFSSALPMEGRSTMDPIFAEDKTYAVGQMPPPRRFKFVSPGFFTSMGTRLVAGRDFTWTDLNGHRAVAMVSESVARDLWNDPAAALGKRIQDPSRAVWREVVGVVEDVRENGVQEKAPSLVYWPTLMQKFYGNPVFFMNSVVYTIRTPRAGTEGLLNQVRQAVWSVNPSLPLVLVRTMQEVYDRSLASTSFTLVMLAIAGGMALVLGIIGIYGVISYSVSQRNREIGIRLALGAQRGELKGMFVRHGLVLASIGVVIGLGAAMGLTQLMSSLLYGVSPLDPLTYVAVPLVLVMAAVVASYLPARRAASVDPVVALRAE